MQRLPVGLFLCPRCLRSRRPSVQDVEAACNSVSFPSLEVLLVKNLVKRAHNAFHELTKLAHSIPPGCDISELGNEQKTKLEEAMLLALSLEAIDTEAYEMAFGSSYMQIFPFNETEKTTWSKIRNRVVASVPRHVIFAASLTRQRSSSNLSSNRRNKRSSGTTAIANGSQAKQRRSEKAIVEEEDADEYCAADKCLKPYSDQVRWIQCETPGCARWYHYVCVGLTVKCAKQIPSYSCSRCSIATASSAVLCP
jgi:hypothetical protein